MSEPSRWSPPGFDAASGPTVPLPTAPRPGVPRPAAHRPTALHPTRQAPFPAPADRGAYGDGYGNDNDSDARYADTRYADTRYADSRYADAHGDYGADDRSDYRDDHRGAYRDDPPPARRRGRGQVFAGVVLLLALMVSVLLGVLTYQALVSVDLISADPLGGLAGWATMFGAVALGALGVFVLALIAFVIARPKALAGIGLAASVLLPVGALFVGVLYGGDVLRQNVQNDVATESADAARTVLEELERNTPDIGPLRDLIVWVAGQGG